MEDIVQVLIVIGVIAFSVVKKLIDSNKEEEKKQRPKVDNPWEAEDVYEDTSPKIFEEGQYSTYTPPTLTIKQPSPKKHTRIADTSPPLQEGTDEQHQEFNIESVEEARRAIIWSEILNRKY